MRGKKSYPLHHLRRAEAILGSKAELARVANISAQAVSNWFAQGKTLVVPAEYCPAIEEATRGLVTCEQLNNRVKWSVVRAHTPA